jgi:hypothetical protein
MIKIMENKAPDYQRQNNSAVLKMIILFLICLLSGSLWYNYKQSEAVDTIKLTEEKMVAEKAVLLSDLEKQKEAYDTAINENSAISSDLAAERAKVIQLITEVKNAKGSVNGLTEIKKKYATLEVKYKELMAQNEELKKQNITLTTQRDSTVAVLGETKKYNDDLLNQNTELTNTVIKASKLSVVGLQTKAYKIKGSGKIVDTDKASATDMLKVNFSIAQNVAARAGDKTYYIQIIDANNNVIGDKKTEKFGDKTLTYSSKTTVKYANKTVNVSQDILVKDFAKGVYFINIFDQAEMVADETLSLR